jgi:hypothetical protein
VTASAHALHGWPKHSAKSSDANWMNVHRM